MGRIAAPAILAVALAAAGLSFPMPQAGASPPATAGRHIVLFDDSVRDPRGVAAEHSRKHGAEVTYVYEHAVKGYAATFRGTGVGDVARDHRVRRIEPDGPVSISATQTGAPWGLDRIDQKVLKPLKGCSPPPPRARA